MKTNLHFGAHRQLNWLNAYLIENVSNGRRIKYYEDNQSVASQNCKNLRLVFFFGGGITDYIVKPFPLRYLFCQGTV